MPKDLCAAPGIISLSPFSLATDVTDIALGAVGLWLGIRTGAGGTVTLTESFYGRSPWLYGQQAFPKNVFTTSLKAPRVSFSFSPIVSVKKGLGGHFPTSGPVKTLSFNLASVSLGSDNTDI